jgi:hypothetical protein
MPERTPKSLVLPPGEEQTPEDMRTFEVDTCVVNGIHLRLRSANSDALLAAGQGQSPEDGTLATLRSRGAILSRETILRVIQSIKEI